MTGSMKISGRALLAGAAIIGAGAAAPPPVKQVVTGPVATYWMSTQTSSGMVMGGGGPGGGRPSAMAMMGLGRGDNVSKSLILQLGSSQRPTGEPVAEHQPPSGLGVGPSLPLLTPRQTTAPTREEPGLPPSYEKPRGRMLIYWGCGEHARPGQPVVIDFARVAAGQMPPEFTRMMQGLQISAAQPPSPTRNTTYGEWPNARTRTQAPASGSLTGVHVIRGNYSPQIQFSMTPTQDFLPPVRMTTNSQIASGAYQLGWQPVSGARGYMASTMGGDGETVVLWSSSEVSSLLFALPDYLRPTDITRLLANRALMAPSQTSCAVPREVAQAAPQSMYQFVAYGGESDFSYPERPADPRQAWNIAWTVKVRYRSATGGLLGMDMPGADDDDAAEAPAGKPKPGKPGRPRGSDLLRGLGVPIPGGR